MPVLDPTTRVPLGRTGLFVTRMGLGTAPIGGLPSGVDGDAVARAAVDAAWDAGLRLFDTAPLYGRGSSERRTGGALRQRERGEFVLSTKAGRNLLPGPAGELAPVFDYSRDAVLRSFEDSLTRLGLDRVDIVHIHDADDHWDAAKSGAAVALAELREQGVIKAVGAGMNQSEMLADFVRAGIVDVVLLAGRYTLLDQSAMDDLLPLCEREGVGVILGGVYNSGVLADPAPGSTFDYRTTSPTVLARAVAMRDVCARYDVPLRAAALRFSSAHPAVSSVVVGARSPEEVTDNVAMARHDIPAGVWRDLKRDGLLGEKAFVPS